MRRSLTGTLCAFVLACSDPGAGAPSATPASASAPRASTAPAATSAGAPTAATPASGAAPTASVAAIFLPSDEPALAEWATSKVVKVPGSTANSCETRMVREWLRVMCVNRSAELGKPTRIKVERGRAPNDRSQGENLKAVNDITTLIVPVRPGTDIAAAFEWENGAHGLVVRWPEGTPESGRVMEFDNPPPPDAAPTATGGAPPAQPAEGAAPSPAVEPPLDDVASIAAAPDDAGWDQAKEARVKGSTAAGCETKIAGDWFRARCKIADASKAVKEILPLKGHRKTQTTVKVEGDVATLVTPYVEGTELHARFSFGDAKQVLVLRWPKGPKPDTIGAFEILK
jgi:hypothetical protein